MTSIYSSEALNYEGCGLCVCQHDVEAVDTIMTRSKDHSMLVVVNTGGRPVQIDLDKKKRGLGHVNGKMISCTLTRQDTRAGAFIFYKLQSICL